MAACLSVHMGLNPKRLGRSTVDYRTFFIFDKRTPLSLRFHAFEVTLSGFAGGEYLPLPVEFGGCRYAVLQCCGLKDEFTLRDNGIQTNEIDQIDETDQIDQTNPGDSGSSRLFPIGIQNAKIDSTVIIEVKFRRCRKRAGGF